MVGGWGGKCPGAPSRAQESQGDNIWPEIIRKEVVSGSEWEASGVKPVAVLDGSDLCQPPSGGPGV